MFYRIESVSEFLLLVVVLMLRVSANQLTLSEDKTQRQKEKEREREREREGNETGGLFFVVYEKKKPLPREATRFQDVDPTWGYFDMNSGGA